MISIKNKKRYIFALLFIFVSNLLYLFACKESTKAEDEEIELPQSDLTYFKHMQELFIVKCASAPGCHGQVDQAKGLNLTDYNDIMVHTVQGELIVQPENGDASFLYRILLEDTMGRPRMPYNGPYLNTNNTTGVKTWIDEGANP
jgi:hypothetical protein